jgi:hypothetical protein
MPRRTADAADCVPVVHFALVNTDVLARLNFVESTGGLISCVVRAQVMKSAGWMFRLLHHAL